jgi:hypothetical protein
MKGVLPWLVRWACRAGTRDFCSALAAEVDPVQNIFSSSYTISMPLSPSPSKLGRQPCWVACLLVCVSGCPPRPLVPRGGDTLTRMRWGGGSHFGRRIIHSGTPRLKGPAGLSACCRVTIPLFSFQLILAPVVHWLALVLRLLCPALYFFIMERRARKES